MQAGQQIVIDPKAPGGVNSPYGLILFDGVCILCSAGCGFVSKRDRRHYFRFIASVARRASACRAARHRS
jgi:predicted DCC family thiol-disulfide oxidoreductase YuxK